MSIEPTTAEEVWISEGQPETAELLAEICAIPEVKAIIDKVSLEGGPDALCVFKCALLIGHTIGKTGLV